MSPFPQAATNYMDVMASSVHSNGFIAVRGIRLAFIRNVGGIKTCRASLLHTGNAPCAIVPPAGTDGKSPAPLTHLKLIRNKGLLTGLAARNRHQRTLLPLTSAAQATPEEEGKHDRDVYFHASRDFSFEEHARVHSQRLQGLAPNTSSKAENNPDKVAGVAADQHLTREAQGQLWEEFHQKHERGRQYHERRYLLREFPVLSTCGHVLEIGCGTGSSVLPILRGNQGAMVYACDVSSRAIEHTAAAVAASDIPGASERLRLLVADPCMLATNNASPCAATRTVPPSVAVDRHVLDPSISDLPMKEEENGCQVLDGAASGSHLLSKAVLNSHANMPQEGQPSSTNKSRDLVLTIGTGQAGTYPGLFQLTGGRPVDVVLLVFTLSSILPPLVPSLLRGIRDVLAPGTGRLLVRDYGPYDMRMLTLMNRQGSWVGAAPSAAAGAGPTGAVAGAAEGQDTMSKSIEDRNPSVGDKDVIRLEDGQDVARADSEHGLNSCKARCGSVDATGSRNSFLRGNGIVQTYYFREELEQLCADAGFSAERCEYGLVRLRNRRTREQMDRVFLRGEFLADL